MPPRRSKPAFRRRSGTPSVWPWRSSWRSRSPSRGARARAYASPTSGRRSSVSEARYPQPPLNFFSRWKPGRVIGGNNRDRRDFTVALGTFERLAPRLAGATLVAECGVKTPEDGWRLRDAGADAVLVGEAAMRDPALVARLSNL